jgi:hypothetical protein
VAAAGGTTGPTGPIGNPGSYSITASWWLGA